MHQRFTALVDRLDTKCQQLLAMPPVAADDVSSVTPHGGIYLFSEGDEHLYTGRTKGPIHVRIRQQFGTNANAASFPWLIAREATGMQATYQTTGSRADLLTDPKFGMAYRDARDRIRRMHVRYVHEPEPLRQALLEIYVAVVAEAKYNNFDTH
ncbi:MAG: hypothetical protein OXG44_00605 [Gammaproteobacteria bacterium]|nr:hypothetical protein [Gammaproteobacteria bacterium]